MANIKQSDAGNIQDGYDSMNKTYLTDKPAQSAPAEAAWMKEQEYFAYDRLPEDGWDYIREDRVAKWLEAYAALRTAQLEERAKNAEWAHGECSRFLAQKSSECSQLEHSLEAERFASKEQSRRAETAESALAQARERTIQECAKILCDCCRIDGWPTDMQAKPHQPYDDGERWVHEYDDGSTIDCYTPKLHTALTSSASGAAKSQKGESQNG